MLEGIEAVNKKREFAKNFRAGKAEMAKAGRKAADQHRMEAEARKAEARSKMEEMAKANLAESIQEEVGSLDDFINEITSREDGVVNPEDSKKVLSIICKDKNSEIISSGLNEGDLLEDKNLFVDIDKALKEYTLNLLTETKIANVSMRAGISKVTALEEGMDNVDLHIKALRENLNNIVSEGIARLKLENVLNKPRAIN